MRPHRGVAPSLSVCPSREHVAPWPLRRIALWSVLPGAKRSRRCIRLPRPVPPFACSCRENLLSKHTHMSVEAYPPDGPQISPRQGSQNFSAKVMRSEKGSPVLEGAHVFCAAPGKFCARQAGGCAVPDPNRFGEPDIRPCHHTHVVVEHPNSGDQTWLTIKRTPTRPSSFLD